MTRNDFGGLRSVSDLFVCAEKMAETFSSLRDDIGNEAYSELMRDYPPLADFMYDCREIVDLLGGSSAAD